MKLPVTIDPRCHDAVLFAVDEVIHYRGLRLHLRISDKGAIVSDDPRTDHHVEVECHGHRKRLAPGTTTEFSGKANEGEK